MSDRYLGESIKKLGFGLMRLPEKNGEIDHAQVCEMVDAFLEAGFTYFDTAYVYNNGASEIAARECLVKRHPRESFTLADKLPLFIVKSREMCPGLLETSLERAGVDYFDFYLLHAMGKESAQLADDLDLWSLMQEFKAQGKVKHIGFSFHDTAEVLDDILTKHPEAEFVQLQINYKDWEDETVQSRLCYETARRHGKPVVIMEPVKGGSLASRMIPEVHELLKKADPAATPASWAVRFAASLGGVVTVLSGMSDLAQVRDNTACMKSFRPLTGEERKILETAAELLKNATAVPCTECRYCVDGCPQHICIPEVFRAYNTREVYKNIVGSARLYAMALEGSGRPEDCLECGACESRCPQKIEIIQNLKRAAKAFAE